ncbi:MAG: hypothetical protein AB1758_24130, partial [Candidatus Eremiobacterota bacterium]
ELARQHPELVLTEVNIDDWNRPAALQHTVRSTPTVRVYDAEGRLLADEETSLDWLEQSFGWRAPTRIRCVGSPGKGP